MGAVRAMVNDGAPNPRQSLPQDLIMGGESLLAGANATVGTTVLTGAQMATGIILRSGSTGAYADTFDTAANIIAALAGNGNADVVPGTTFRLLVINSVAFADTVAASADGSTVVSTATTTAIAASTWREFLITIQSASPASIQQMVVDGSTAVLLFVLSSGTNSRSMGPLNNLPTPGAVVSGTGIPAAATVLNVNLGQGGALGVTISANTTVASGAGGTAVTFTPRVKVEGLRSGPL